MDRFTQIFTSGQASNDYQFSFSAFRSQPGGAAAVIQVRNDSTSVAYVLRKPRLVTKRRVEADFGERGRISLRFERKARKQRFGNRCGHLSFGSGAFKGSIRFDGESDFTRVRSGGGRGYSISSTQARRCRGGDFPGPFPFFPLREVARLDPFNEASILSSCGPRGGAGFVAFEFSPGSEAEFFASKFERSKEMQIIRMTSLEGPARTFAVDGTGEAAQARLTPPEPFAGRGFFKDEELRGNLETTFPGAGTVDLTPGVASLGGVDDPLEAGECYPSFFGFFGVGIAGSSLRVALADAVLGRVLSEDARRLLAG